VNKNQSKNNGKKSIKKRDPSRRSFLVSSASGLSAAWLATRWSGILEAQAFAAQATKSGPPDKFEFFSPEDAVEIESVVAQIIPTDDTPGAREAGTVYFIDRTLMTFDRDEQPRYTQGFKELQGKTRELFPDANKFSQLTSAQQVQVLTAMEETPFFALVRQHTIVGFLADPIHGGNRDQIGWKLIGFEGKFDYAPPFGFYDRGYKQDA
jgi:gluconate 2-dehydrogenase gamma chain